MHVLPMLVALFQLTTVNRVQLADTSMQTEIARAWLHRAEAGALCISGHRIVRHGDATLTLTRFTPVQSSDSACTQDRYVGVVYLVSADSSYREIMFTYAQVVLQRQTQWYVMMFVYAINDQGVVQAMVVSR